MVIEVYTHTHTYRDDPLIIYNARKKRVGNRARLKKGHYTTVGDQGHTEIIYMFTEGLGGDKIC